MYQIKLILKRSIVPIAIHFVLVQSVMTLGTHLLSGTGADPNSYVLLLNGLASLLVWPILEKLYKKDHAMRENAGLIGKRENSGLRAADAVFLLFTGAALAMCVNFSLSFFRNLLHVTEYTQRMDAYQNGKGLLSLILYIGILAPIVEELVFRRMLFLRMRDHMKLPAAAALSGVIFGLYHGNLTQLVYASILGTVFAFMTEWTGNLWGSVLMHMGANIWSLVLTKYGDRILGGMSIPLFLAFQLLCILILVEGIVLYRQRGQDQTRAI